MERIKTGIAELDAMLKGGFMPGDAVLLTGSAGTGKTTLALQYLVNGVTKFGDKGIYVTFEELPDQIYRDALNLGWDLRKLEDEDKLRIICTSPNIMLETDEGDNILDQPIKEIQPRRIVIDALSHLEMFVPKEEIRSEVYRLVRHLKMKNLSSLLLWENPQILGQSFSVTDAGIGFLVDCIVVLKFVEIESAMKKALMVLKMRGSDHDKHLREFQLTSEGVKMFAPFDGYASILSGSPTKRIEDRFAEAFVGTQRREGKP